MVGARPAPAPVAAGRAAVASAACRNPDRRFAGPAAVTRAGQRGVAVLTSKDDEAPEPGPPAIRRMPAKVSPPTGSRNVTVKRGVAKAATTNKPTSPSKTASSKTASSKTASSKGTSAKQATKRTTAKKATKKTAPRRTR